jgi:hypothetical protein
MKKVILILVCVITMISCEYQDSRSVCNCEEREKVATFISDNIKAANNMSDEEMEDVIRQLEWTAVKTICHREVVWVTSNHYINYDKEKVDSCRSIYSY